MDSASGNRRLDTARVGALARRQHGVVAIWQLEALGVSPSAVQRRVAAGHLLRLHRGVYAVGHIRISVRGRWMAAVLACGGGGSRVIAESPRGGGAVGAAKRSGGHDRRHRTGNAQNRRDPLPRHPQARPPRPHDDRRDPGHVAEPHPARPGRAPQPQRLRSTLEAVQRRDLLDVQALSALLAAVPDAAASRPSTLRWRNCTIRAPFIQSELERHPRRWSSRAAMQRRRAGRRGRLLLAGPAARGRGRRLPLSTGRADRLRTTAGVTPGSRSPRSAWSASPTSGLPGTPMRFLPTSAVY